MYLVEIVPNNMKNYPLIVNNFSGMLILPVIFNLFKLHDKAKKLENKSHRQLKTYTPSHKRTTRTRASIFTVTSLLSLIFSHHCS